MVLILLMCLIWVDGMGLFVASRSMIITGKTIWDESISDQWIKKENLEAAQQSWGKLLEQKGYQTYMTGKWHVSINPNEVFKRLEMFDPACQDFFKKKIERAMIDRRRDKQIFEGFRFSQWRVLGRRKTFRRGN